MNVLLLGAVVWFTDAVTTALVVAVVWFILAALLAVGVGRVLARADVDLADLDVSREEWQAHCDQALSVFDDLAWSATDEAAYRVTVERAT